MSNWNDFFKWVQKQDYAKKLNIFLDNEYQTCVCYPPRDKMFNAFKLTPLEKIKVVIIGQDPYHEEKQAMGLSFSVPSGVILPPSLINIYKEIENEFHISMNFSNGDLTYLAKQGVLLLNSVLSVREHQPNSHNIPEYKLFLKDVLTLLEEQNQPIVYILWGNNARKLKEYLYNPNHLILEGVHPSPLSANRGGFFENNYFIQTNDFLLKNKVKPIDWINS